MSTKDIHRKQIMETFIRNITHISDEEYQKRVWIEGQGPECDDFGEFTSYFFDESESILRNYIDFGITNTQHNLLLNFHKSLDEFTENNYDPKEFISSLEWKKIIEMAKEVLKAFNYEKKPD